MQEFQQRVVDEKAALDDKLSRLKPFIASEKFMTVSPEEQERMRRQVVLMGLYSDVLGERIAAFV